MVGKQISVLSLEKLIFSMTQDGEPKAKIKDATINSLVKVL